MAVKCGEVELKRTPTKSLSRQEASALTTGLSSTGQSSLVVRMTGPGRLMVQARVSVDVFRPRAFRSGVTRPAMTDDVEMEARGKSHVGFEGERFLLLAPAAQGPLHRERARQQANGETGVLKPARGKMKSGLQPGAAGLPSQIGDAAFSEACRLDPLQHVAGAPPVVTDKPGVPEEGERERHDHVDENETPHVASWQKSYFL